MSAGGPVSLWRANDNALDSVGGNDGTLVGGASYGPGRIGQAFSFANPQSSVANQFVGVADSASLRITNALTMSAWIYPTGPGNSTNPGPDGIPEGGIIVNKEYAYEMARFSDGTIRWAFFNGGPGWNWINSGAVAPLNAWTHVVVTYGNNEVRTYINGAQAGAPYTVSGTIAAALSELRIGGRQLTGAGTFRQNFDGRIDEVGIQNRALTPAEVLALHNAAPPLTATVPGTAGGTANTNLVGAGGTAPVSAGLWLNAGDAVTITATGQTQRGSGFSLLGPDGEPTTCAAGGFTTCLANNQRIQALIARVGTGSWQFVGAGPTVITATSAGLLEFAVNDDSFSDNTGDFVVTVTRTTP